MAFFFFLKLNVLFLKWQIYMLMRACIQTALKRQKSEGSRCSNIQFSCQSGCLKSELGYCIIKIDEAQAENPYKEALYSISKQTSCDVFSGLFWSQIFLFFFSLWKSLRKEYFKHNIRFTWNKANKVKFEYV